MEETIGALDHIVRSGRALYVGISSYNSQHTREAIAILESLGTPCLIHQPCYNLLNRWIEHDGVKETLTELGVGSIAFTPLAQGLLTSRYLNGISDGSRATLNKSLASKVINARSIAALNRLNQIAQRHEQSLAQMAIAWVLHENGITSALIGASKPEQIQECVGAIKNLKFSNEELAVIDTAANENDFNRWAAASSS